MTAIFRLILLPIALFTLSCGDGTAPATPEQKQELKAIIETAKTAVESHKEYKRLAAPEFQEARIEDYFSKDKTELIFASTHCVVMAKDGEANALFKISAQIDSVNRELKDAFVFLKEGESGWIAESVYILDKGEQL